MMQSPAPSRRKSGKLVGAKNHGAGSLPLPLGGAVGFRGRLRRPPPRLGLSPDAEPLIDSLCFLSSSSNNLSNTGATYSWVGRGKLSTEPSMASSNNAVLALSWPKNGKTYRRCSTKLKTPDNSANTTNKPSLTTEEVF